MRTGARAASRSYRKPLATLRATGENMIIEVDGMLWRPVPGASASADKFIQAGSLIHEIYEQRRWNPWLIEDRAKEHDDALKICEQWTRARPSRPFVPSHSHASAARG